MFSPTVIRFLAISTNHLSSTTSLNFYLSAAELKGILYTSGRHGKDTRHGEIVACKGHRTAKILPACTVIQPAILSEDQLSKARGQSPNLLAMRL